MNHTGVRSAALSEAELQSERLRILAVTGFFAVLTLIEFAYRPLASPALLVFFILIIMSVLRLSPAISILAECSACVSYFCAALYLGWTPPSVGETASFTQSAVTLNAITLLMGGVVAAKQQDDLTAVAIKRV